MYQTLRKSTLVWLFRVVAIYCWELPWYMDCRHSREWSAFRSALRQLGSTAFSDDMFWWSQSLLEKTEPIFFKVQDSKHLHFLCNPNATTEAAGWVPPMTDDEDSVFAAQGGTDQWSAEERERRSYYVKDFCYYGYITAAVYRSRLVHDSVPGVQEGRRNAQTLLKILLMSRSNSIDFLDSSGWPITLDEYLRRLYPPDGPGPPPEALDQEAKDDTDFPYSFARPSDFIGGAPVSRTPQQENQRQTRPYRIAAFGYHTSLVLELVSLWTEFLDDVVPLEVAAHILEPECGTAADVRKESLCRDFRDGDLCAWDARLLALNKRHVHRSRLPVSRLPSPLIEDPVAFINDFVDVFQTRSVEWLRSRTDVDARIDGADLYLCTEPAILCGAVASAFAGRPVLGYFANPLLSYVPSAFAEVWLTQFRELATRSGMQRKAPFLAVASTRFLAEQMRFQTGARVLAARPLAVYLGPPRGIPGRKFGEVVVLRAPSVFWHSACILNSLAKLNEKELGSAHRSGGGIGIPVPGLEFIASEELKDGASEAIAAFEATIIFPYDVSQMRLYELYALGVPILLPAREWLPVYIYRGLTTIDDFNHALPDLDLREGGRVPNVMSPQFEHHPFDRMSWPAVSSWTKLTHWSTLPHLLHCAGVAEMLLRLARDDLRPVAAGMRRRQEQDVVKAARFWTAALASLGLSSGRPRSRPGAMAT